MMTTQRLIEFTTDATGTTAIREAVREAFVALRQEQPDSVKLAYWKVADQNRFVAIIELDEEAENPLLGITATVALPQIIGSHVEGGYPQPQPVELLGAYGFDL